MPGELSGRRIVVTRARHQAGSLGEALEGLGAQVIYLPAIEIGPADDLAGLDQALGNLDSYDWAIFTSANGVQACLERMEKFGEGDWPANLQVAAIGPKTEQALRANGVRVDFRPDEYIAEAIPGGLGDLAGKKFLLLRADLARPALAELLRAGGGIVDEITAYRTLAGQPDPQALAALSSGVQAITFTSSSTVRNFVAMLAQAELDPTRLPGSPKIACIGPITAQTARQLGLSVDLVAKTYTIEGLVTSLQTYFSDPSHVRTMP